MLSLDLRIGTLRLRVTLGVDRPEPEPSVVEAGPGTQSAALELADPFPTGFVAPDEMTGTVGPSAWSPFIMR